MQFALRRSYSAGRKSGMVIPEFTTGVLKKLGWTRTSLLRKMKSSRRVQRSNPMPFSCPLDLSGGIHQRVTDLSRLHTLMATAVWTLSLSPGSLPDPIPVHSESPFTRHAPSVGKYPTRPDAQQFPGPQHRFHRPEVPGGHRASSSSPANSGAPCRLVAYEGGGEETRSTKCWADIEQDIMSDQSGGARRARSRMAVCLGPRSR